jgi:hypothetical protein
MRAVKVVKATSKGDAHVRRRGQTWSRRAVKASARVRWSTAKVTIGGAAKEWVLLKVDLSVGRKALVVI